MVTHAVLIRLLSGILTTSLLKSILNVCLTKCIFSVKQEDCGLNFPDDFKTEVDQLKLDGNCDFGGGKFSCLGSC